MLETTLSTKDKICTSGVNELKIINEQEVLGKQFRVYGTVDEPLFLAKDVAEWIEHSNLTMMVNSVDEDEKVVRRTKDSLGRENTATFLTENGLYEVLMLSRKPIAKQFKGKVKEILKSLRVNGGYIANQENLTPEQIVANALIVAQNIILQKDRQIEEMQPKADYFDELVDRNLLTSFRDTAKEFGVKESDFIQWLICKNYIYRDGRNKLQPYATAMSKGLFELKEYSSRYSNHVGTQTLITPKGRETFRLLIKI